MEKGEDLSSDLSEAGRSALFHLLGLDEFLLSPSCDRTREPYMPSVNGWNNGKSRANVADILLTMVCYFDG